MEENNNVTVIEEDNGMEDCNNGGNKGGFLTNLVILGGGIVVGYAMSKLPALAKFIKKRKESKEVIEVEADVYADEDEE